MRSQNRIQVLQFGQNAGGAFEGRHGLFLPHVLRVSKHDALRCVALVRKIFSTESTPPVILDDASLLSRVSFLYRPKIAVGFIHM